MPIASRAVLVRIYDPFQRRSEKGAFQALRAAAVISHGVGQKPRTKGGTVRGTVHLYCGLNRDSVRLYRRGELSAARDIAAAAGEVEERPDFKELVEKLADYPMLPPELQWVDVQRLLKDANIAALLQSTANAVLAVQQEYVTLLSATQNFSGIVASIQSALAVVDTIRGQFEIPLIQLAGLGRELPGAAFELNWEMVDAFDSVVSTSPAIPAESGDVLPSPFSPDPIVLRPRSRAQHKASLAVTASSPPPLPLPLPRR